MGEKMLVIIQIRAVAIATALFVGRGRVAIKKLEISK